MPKQVIKNHKDIEVEVKSFGCSANFGEGEVIKGVLRRDGFNLKDANSQQSQSPREKLKTDSMNPSNSETTYDIQGKSKLPPDSANSIRLSDKLLVLNVCTVKGDHGPLKEIKNALAEDHERKIVLGGCVTSSLAKTVQKMDKRISITTTHGVSQITSAVQATLTNKPLIDLKKKTADRINLPRVRTNPAIGIVPVSSGCMDRCSFCSTVSIKGRLKSYPIESITQEVAELVADDCKEIWLTGQDAACYGFDLEQPTNLAKLVKTLIQIPGDFMIRLGMGNPRHLLSFWEELAEVMQSPKVFKFIHLPVQSGSTDVLAEMKRKHSVKDYTYLVRKFSEAIPNLTISTDIIVGFPGETEEDFRLTLDLLKETRPSVCNRTRFVPRDGTLAAQMTDISGITKKDRSRRVTELFKSIVLENNQQWVGWTGRVIIDEYGKEEGTMMGRNEYYKPVVVPGTYPFGKSVHVTIIAADTFCLISEVKMI